MTKFRALMAVFTLINLSLLYLIYTKDGWRGVIIVLAISGASIYTGIRSERKGK